ncbi:site-specific integrase [Vibrio vulnificus]
MKHLTKRNDVYYYQRRIPTHLKEFYDGVPSIKFSLKTTERKRAILLARQHSAHLDKEFFELDLSLINKELEKAPLPKLHIKQESPKGSNILVEQGVKPITPPTMPLEAPVRASKLSNCIELYLSTKKIDKISEKALGRYKSRLDLLLKILKDKDINSFTRDDALAFKHQLVQLPPNINNNPKYKGKTIEEIISFGDTPIGTHTINDTFKVISGFFEWLVLNEKALKNPFTKLQVKKETRASEERKVFTESDLKKIFSLDVFKRRSKDAWHYWLPILGLYTGARINELCQLYTDNVKEVEGIWCININADREDQKLKSKSSWRVIPIHSKLIELGFIDYVQSLPEASRVFPTLKYLPQDGYGKYPSKWFSIQRDKALSGEERHKKTFHSFRHTVANQFKQLGVEYSPASYILGHSDETMTYGRYGKDYSPSVLKPVVDSLEFDLVIPSIFHK